MNELKQIFSTFNRAHGVKWEGYTTIDDIQDFKYVLSDKYPAIQLDGHICGYHESTLHPIPKDPTELWQLIALFRKVHGQEWTGEIEIDGFLFEYHFKMTHAEGLVIWMHLSIKGAI